MSDAAHFTPLQDLPDPLDYAFVPNYWDASAGVAIVIVFHGLEGFVDTAITCKNRAEAERFCDLLNRPLGHDRAAWTALLAKSHGHATAATIDPGDLH